MGVNSKTFTREVHKQIAKIVINNGDILDDIFAEIDQNEAIVTIDNDTKEIDDGV